MLRRMYISDNGRLQEDNQAEPLVYVYTTPTDEEKKQLIEQYKIDEYTLNSSLNPDELPRLEFEPDELAVDLVKSLSMDKRLYKYDIVGSIAHSQVLASLMDTRASIIANNWNIRIKMLTILTIAIMLPTLVVNIFSMNVRIPLISEDPASFWIISALAALSSLTLGFLWWRKRW
ncbi:MAG: CorA family divalent cation transporter [Sedimentisphaerales bacterium]